MRISPGLAVTSLLATASPAFADTSPSRTADSITIDVELTESAPKKDAQTLTFTLALAGDHGCASAETSQPTLGYQLKVCRDGEVLTFEVKRDERTKDGSSSRQLRVSSKLAAGKRVVIAKIARGDTDATEIAAKVQ